MNRRRLSLVSFKLENGAYTASMPLDQFLSNEGKDFEASMKRAVKLYTDVLVSMKTVLAEIEHLRKERKRLPARLIWELGELIFTLISRLEKEGFQIDGIYEHLCRDLQVKRKWLEKVVILRRYVPEVQLIPEGMNWSKLEKGTRRIAENLVKGIMPS